MIRRRRWREERTNARPNHDRKACNRVLQITVYVAEESRRMHHHNKQPTLMEPRTGRDGRSTKRRGLQLRRGTSQGGTTHTATCTAPQQGGERRPRRRRPENNRCASRRRQQQQADQRPSTPLATVTGEQDFSCTHIEDAGARPKAQASEEEGATRHKQRRRGRGDANHKPSSRSIARILCSPDQYPPQATKGYDAANTCRARDRTRQHTGSQSASEGSGYDVYTLRAFAIRQPRKGHQRTGYTCDDKKDGKKDGKTTMATQATHTTTTRASTSGVNRHRTGPQHAGHEGRRRRDQRPRQRGKSLSAMKT